MLAACSTLAGMQYPLSDSHNPGDSFMQIRLRGTLHMPFQEVDGFKVTELSALAWDEDAQLLYALNDRGTLFHLRVTMEQQTLQKVEVLHALPLRDAKAQPLTRGWRDSEGMVALNANNGIAGDTELLIAFEVQPRIWRYNPQGKRLGEVTLPPDLQDIRNYRDKNKALESVAWNTELGVLTTPELPLSALPKNRTRLYSTNGTFWEWNTYPAPESAVVALEALPQHRLLVLERAFTSIWKPLIISLREVQLTDACRGGQQACAVRNLAVLDNSQGWLIDNFEGLTHHQGRFFFTVSDDNENGLQRTLLSYFEAL